MLINVKHRMVVPIHQLGVLAVRYVYDKKHMKKDDIKMMRQSIVHWANKIAKTGQEEEDLQKIARFLKKDEAGKFDERKQLFKDHKINFMKFHRMPHLQELGEC